MKRPRSNPKQVGRLVSHYAECYRLCVREHWDLDRYIARRNDWMPPHVPLTNFDSGRVYQAARTFFDIVNCGEHMEWRLGLADIATAIPAKAWTYGDLPDGTYNMPTHGAHFWKGTDIPFNGWQRMDREGPVTASGEAP